MRYLVLDLETLPIANAADFVTLDDIAAPSTYKDPEKIAAYCDAQRVKRINEAALDLDLARICAVGVMTDRTPAPVVMMLKDEAAEAEELARLAEDLDQQRPHTELLTIVTFNGFKYDLPLLMRRAKYLKVPFPRINLDRYRSPHIDLYEELTMRGAVRAHPLRWYFRRHDWVDLLQADPLENGGADVSQAIAEGRWADVEAHVTCDIAGTHRLAQWMGAIPMLQAVPA